MKRMRWAAVAATFGLVLFYARRIPSVPFDEVYERVEVSTVASLRAFRDSVPLRHLRVEGVEWSYRTTGVGPEALVFLHGMGGAGDIWWQQIESLADRYRIVAPTYPAVSSLEQMSIGVIRIMDHEGIDQATLVGTSLGGQLTQYLMTRASGRITRVVLGNTFPPNDFYAQDLKLERMLLPVLPGWLVMRTFRSAIENQLYPASGRSELVRAYLKEQSFGEMSKAQFAGRFRCVIEQYDAPDAESLGIPVLIIESNNDPSVPEHLRDQLRDTYSGSVVVTLNEAGHFPYLNMPERYRAVLEDFLAPEELASVSEPDVNGR